MPLPQLEQYLFLHVAPIETTAGGLVKAQGGRCPKGTHPGAQTL